MSTPELHLQTLFRLDGEGRITSTREPGGSRGPLFSLVRGIGSCAWASRADVPKEIADELDRLAREEPPASDLRTVPVHAERYLSLLRDRIEPGKEAATGGPAFLFPDALQAHEDVVVVEDERLLERHFRGWLPGEIAAGRAPVLAIVERGYPVSVCFCARLSELAAEAGVDTAEAYRGRGLCPRVTAAWALAVRALGRIPLYSTSWENQPSLAVARKLKLVAYASSWHLSD